MKTFRILLAAAALFAFAALAPSAVTAKAPPIHTQDSCAASFFVEDAAACGGTVTFYLEGQWWSAGYTTTYCKYRQVVNGQPTATYVIQTYSGWYTCPSQPQF